MIACASHSLHPVKWNDHNYSSFTAGTARVQVGNHREAPAPLSALLSDLLKQLREWVSAPLSLDTFSLSSEAPGPGLVLGQDEGLVISLRGDLFQVILQRRHLLAHLALGRH